MPDRLKLDFVLWSRDAVHALIVLHCGFQMPIWIAGEYIKRWGVHPAAAFEAYLSVETRGDKLLAGNRIPQD